DGEGLSGILLSHVSAWYYKPNLGGGRFGPGDTARFADMAPLATKPSLGGAERFLDLAGDGQLDVVSLDAPVTGFYERTDDAWQSFRTFVTAPDVDWRDPNLRFIDITGDGLTDVMITEDDTIVWYPSLGEDGFGGATRVAKFLDEE